MQRLVARLSYAPETTWAVKGAQALLVRLPNAPRTTRDIDAVVQATSSDDAVEAFAQAIERPLPDQDFLSFKVRGVSSSPIRPDLVKIKIQPTMDLGQRMQKLSVISMDLLVADSLGFDPDLIELTPKIDIGRFTDWPEVPVVSSAVHVAEKLVATATTHGDHASTRDRDFTDLVLLCQHFPPDVDELTRQLHSVMASPRPENNTVVLPRSFTPSPSAAALYQTLPDLPPLPEAVRIVRRAVDPALDRYHTQHAAAERSRSIMHTAMPAAGARSQQPPTDDQRPPHVQPHTQGFTL
ncbi:nucleotidyl transferase AbiEii/AbiGii toxin family protein [Actinomyces faecalis]|uniref:nucleotidyl transferase AbiEii/AbiGii toxin family protein n=1 Tax=Actinomyces faecalis TaxID=2722820 RepID=UPI0015576355|nr:nucleotidyl transferase AbiEii/AbiGii toxin family protein [Actinomyces faecalis]